MNSICSNHYRVCQKLETLVSVSSSYRTLNRRQYFLRAKIKTSGPELAYQLSKTGRTVDGVATLIRRLGRPEQIEFVSYLEPMEMLSTMRSYS